MEARARRIWPDARAIAVGFSIVPSDVVQSEEQTSRENGGVSAIEPLDVPEAAMFRARAIEPSKGGTPF